jgi:hypothetical protein
MLKRIFVLTVIVLSGICFLGAETGPFTEGDSETQITLLITHSGTFKGIQFGVANDAENIQGAQLGVANNVDSEEVNSNMLQLGFINKGANLAGVQIGLFNVCESLKGVQIGLINYAVNSKINPLCIGINVAY